MRVKKAVVVVGIVAAVAIMADARYLTVAVAAEDAVADPAAFLAVTASRILEPTSAAVGM